MEILLSSLISFVLGILAGKLLEYDNDRNTKKILKKWNDNIKQMKLNTKENLYWKLGPLSINVVSWLEIHKKNSGWLDKDIMFTLSGTTKDISKEFCEYIEAFWDSESSMDTEIFNGKRCGLLSLSLDEQQNKTIPTLEFYQTDYKTFISTNKNYKQFNPYFLKKYFDERILGIDGYKYLRSSSFSNDLATAITVITKDNQVILNKRSSKVHILPDKIHTSIAEGMSPEQDQINGIPNVFSTIIRGAKEEIGITVLAKDINILGIGIYTDFVQPYVVGTITSSLTFDEIKNHSEHNLSHWEGKYFPIEFSVESLAPYLFDKYGNTAAKTAELAKISLVLSLVNKYGKEYVESKLYDYSEILYKMK